MESFVEMLNNSYIILGIIIVNIILIILYVSSNLKLRKLNKEYRNFMKKVGKGDDLEENLKVYINKVEKVEKENKEIEDYCDSLNKEIAKTIKKVGIVRYNAFKDTGSDLSFALALLNESNDGVVLNGIYSREMSNIYAKPIKDGKSKYTISEQEQEAIDKAIESNGYIVKWK